MHTVHLIDWLTDCLNFWFFSLQLCSPGSSYFYAYPGRKPQLLAHLESYLNKELQSLNAQEPKFQELKLQVLFFWLTLKEITHIKINQLIDKLKTPKFQSRFQKLLDFKHYLLWPQVYRDVFALFIKEFKTYQPLLSDIKREYETTLGKWPWEKRWEMPCCINLFIFKT